MSDSPILAFAHIPKNAGSFFTYLLRSYYGLNHCRAFSENELYSYKDLIRDKVIYPNLKAISGHQIRPFIDYKEYEERLVWCLLIRNPYHRFPSQYRWWCKQNNSDISFEAWCHERGEKFSDFQCRWISGGRNHQASIEIIRKKKIVIGFQSDLKNFVASVSLALNLTDFIWKEDLIINEGGKDQTAFDPLLIERYNSEDIKLYNYLLNHMHMESEHELSWEQPLSFKHRLNYYANLSLHGFYKSLRSFDKVY